MKRNFTITAICAVIIISVCLVSCRKFDGNKFFETAKKYYLGSFKGLQTDVITNYDGTVDTVYITTNIDSFMHSNCDFLITENDVKSYAENIKYNIHGKIKSWKIDYYLQGKETSYYNELRQTNYYLFGKNQHCYYNYEYTNWEEEDRKFHTFIRYNICGKRTEEKYIFHEEDGKYSASGLSEIIQYDKKGRRAAYISFIYKDTLKYNFNIYNYPDRNTVYISEYYKSDASHPAKLEYILLKRYDSNGNIIRDSSKFYDATYTYDSQNRIKQEKEDNDCYTWITEYEYKGDKLISKKSYKDGVLYRSSDITYKDGKSITKAFDENFGEHTIIQEYDKHGNCIRKTTTSSNGDIVTEIHTIEYYD